MTEQISGYGLRVRLIASKTFPNGVTLSQFADDGDALDNPAIVLAETAMGLNGDLVTWGKATPIAATINVIPDSADDQVLQVLAEANRIGKNKKSANDLIQMAVIYPSGKTMQLTNGVMTSAMIGNSVQSSGRLKTKPYVFNFENKTGTSS